MHFEERWAELVADFPITQWQGRTIRRLKPLPIPRRRKPRRNSVAVQRARAETLALQARQRSAQVAAARLARVLGVA